MAYIHVRWSDGHLSRSGHADSDSLGNSMSRCDCSCDEYILRESVCRTRNKGGVIQNRIREDHSSRDKSNRDDHG